MEKRYPLEAVPTPTSQPAYTTCEVVSLKGHPQFNERWLQDKIAENPSLLGLGDLELKDKERIQPRAGRLDLLLQDPDTKRRFEVELQLGETDESHVIRSIEYWDIERKRYPQYEHCAVIIAEDITSRFLNVINLFNGTIPLIAIQVKALLVNGKITLFFTKVVDELQRGLIEEDESELEETDRNYWENRASKKTVAQADSLLSLIQSFAPEFQLKFNKHYIGLAQNGNPNNFAVFRPRKTTLNADIKLSSSKEIQEKLENAEIELLEYDNRYNAYRLKLTLHDIDKNRALLTELLQASYKQHS